MTEEKKEATENVPICEIRIVNPRSRNKVTFQSIVTSIGMAGLKKPITLHRRELEPDGTRYDLVCGQGRLEGLTLLGETTISAILVDANLKRRCLMSIVENIARYRPANVELIREIRRLLEQKDSIAEIARKVGHQTEYISAAVRLLRQGEDGLVQQVEAGKIPLRLAIQIATCNSAELQRALSEAYEKGELRGAKLLAVKKLVDKRLAKKRVTEKHDPTLSSEDLVREYDRQTHRQRALVIRATAVHQRLVLLRAAVQQLLKDDHFVTLLRAESLDKIPEHLASRQN